MGNQPRHHSLPIIGSGGLTPPSDWCRSGISPQPPQVDKETGPWSGFGPAHHIRQPTYFRRQDPPQCKGKHPTVHFTAMRSDDEPGSLDRHSPPFAAGSSDASACKCCSLDTYDFLFQSGIVPCRNKRGLAISRPLSSSDRWYLVPSLCGRRYNKAITNIR